MGKPTTRMMVRRDLKHAQARIDKIEDYLARCGMLYETQHPKVFEMFCGCLAVARMLKESLNKLRDHL